jgi:hypothetical protein
MMDPSPIIPPEPEQTGTKDTQLRGEMPPLSNLQHDVQSGGLQGAAMEPVLAAAQLRASQRDILQIVARGVDHELSSRQEQIAKLQEDNVRLQVNNARVDERLRSGQLQSGGQLLMASLGGTFLGYGIGKIESGANAFGIVVSLIGIIMLIYGCWPVISIRWWHRG